MERATRANREASHRLVVGEGEGEGEEREEAETPTSRVKRERGRRPGGPCLWETSYYLGED